MNTDTEYMLTLVTSDNVEYVQIIPAYRLASFMMDSLKAGDVILRMRELVK